jgi:RHS repeat-associated protein
VLFSNYSFNGKEKDDEVYGDGNFQDYGMRCYDDRLGRFLSVDPLTSSYAAWSPYAYAMNRPIQGIDLDGLEFVDKTTALFYANPTQIVQQIKHFSSNFQKIWHKNHTDDNPVYATITWNIPNQTNAPNTTTTNNPGSGNDQNTKPQVKQATDLVPFKNKKGEEKMSDFASPTLKKAGGGNNKKAFMSTTTDASKKGPAAQGAKGVVTVVGGAAQLVEEGYAAWEGFVVMNATTEVNSQFDDLKKSIDLLNKAVATGDVDPKYQNGQDLSALLNVIYSGNNTSDKKEIYDLGIKIYNKQFETPVKSLEKPVMTGTEADATKTPQPQVIQQ